MPSPRDYLGSAGPIIHHTQTWATEYSPSIPLTGRVLPACHRPTCRTAGSCVASSGTAAAVGSPAGQAAPTKYQGQTRPYFGGSTLQIMLTSGRRARDASPRPYRRVSIFGALSGTAAGHHPSS